MARRIARSVAIARARSDALALRVFRGARAVAGSGAASFASSVHCPGNSPRASPARSARQSRPDRRRPCTLLAARLGLYVRLTLRRRGRRANADTLAQDGVDPRGQGAASGARAAARLVPGASSCAVPPRSITIRPHASAASPRSAGKQPRDPSKLGRTCEASRSPGRSRHTARATRRHFRRARACRLVERAETSSVRSAVRNHCQAWQKAAGPTAIDRVSCTRASQGTVRFVNPAGSPPADPSLGCALLEAGPEIEMS